MTIYVIHKEDYHETESGAMVVNIPKVAKHVTLKDTYVLYAVDVTK